MGILRLLFGLTATVTRRTYAIAGFSLMAFKYAIDASLVYAVTGRPYMPWSFLSPLWSLRVDDFPADSEFWLFPLLAVIALPFLWIGLSMSVRRAIDAGATPLLGLGFAAPFLNFIIIALLLALPSRRKETPDPTVIRPSHADHAVAKSVLGSILGASVLGALMVAVSVYGLRDYGAVLFFLTPILVGCTSAIALNRTGQRGLGLTLVAGQASAVTVGLALLLFAFEGVICLAMAAPIVGVLTGMGSFLGWFISRVSMPTPRQTAYPLLVLPFLAFFEAKTFEPPVREVRTVIEIEAPADQVFHNVVAFSELPPPSEWILKSGVAYPIRARMIGEGVGAVRHCEFSTGPFVEPITHWEAPICDAAQCSGGKLAFDVAAQPRSMEEWSPYSHVNAPHVDGYMKSLRGQFLIVPLSRTRTRLEGTTWYRNEMAPALYWTIFSDALLHTIHGRVLEHIKSETERGER